MEGGENFIPPQEVKEGLKTEEEIIESRFNQTDASKLAEYITGLRPDDPKMVERLIEDQKVVRGKYGLPDWFLRYDDVAEYKNCLMEIIKKEDINVRSIAEYTILFNNVSATAVSLNEKEIVTDVNTKDGVKEYGESLRSLEHELIHSIQTKRYPKMSVEQREYEAYVSEKPVIGFKSDSSNIEKNFFDFPLKKSVLISYYHHNEKHGEDIQPVWNNPEYFLKNVDGISDKKIQDYKKEKRNIDIIK